MRGTRCGSASSSGGSCGGPRFARRLVLGLAALTTLSAAGCERSAPPGAEARRIPDGVRVLREIEFGRPPGRPLLLDLYLPDRRRSLEVPALPALVHVFGGGWMTGHRDLVLESGAVELVRRGYAVAAVDYRLSHEATFPAQIRDVKTAICWLRAKAERFGIDPERIGIWGPSAGGHLAALAGTSGGVPELEGSGCDAAGALGSRVQAVVDFYGPIDFLQMDAHMISDEVVHTDPDSAVSRLLGGPLAERTAAAARANPITWIDPRDPPFLIVHGDADWLVPLHQSELLVRALSAQGVEATLHIVHGGRHGAGGEFGSQVLRARVFEFLAGALRAPAP